MKVIIKNKKAFLSKCYESNIEELKDLNLDNLKEIEDKFDFYELSELLVKANIPFIRLNEYEMCGEDEAFFLDGFGDEKPIDYDCDFWEMSKLLGDIYSHKDEFIVEIYI